MRNHYEEIFYWVIIVGFFLLSFVCFLAFVDANSERIRIQEKFNDQPRVKPAGKKLKWYTKLLSILALQPYK